MDALGDLEARGLVHQMSHPDELRAAMAAGPITLYLGIDPTGPSLHVGHLLALMVLKRLHGAGHRVIPLMGGGTAMIGDPSGKSAERNLQSRAAIAANADRIRAQIRDLLGWGETRVIHADNWDWLSGLDLIGFLRDVGKYFSVNAMIQKDSVRTRIEREGEGISFTEFSYQLLQGYDFLELHRRHGAILQIGGSDQWGNIVGGADLIRRFEGKRAFALTCPLLTDAAGNKFGKTEQGALFLDPDLTSPYRFHQFWLNQPDGETGRLLRMMTELPLEEIAALEATLGAPERTAQRRLAEAMTDLVHGPAQTRRAEQAAAAVFGGRLHEQDLALLRAIRADVPSLALAPGRLAAGVTLAELLVETGAVPSRKEARRQAEQGAVTLNGAKIAADALDRPLTPDDLLHGEVAALGKGKRNTFLVFAG